MRPLQINREEEPFLMTLEEGKSRYRLGANTFRAVANQANAVLRFGRTVRYSRNKLDEYFNKLSEADS